MGQRAAASGCFQPALQDFSSLPGSSCREGGIPTVFRENSEYDEAKNEQGKLYSRIAELEEILQHVVIVDESNAPTNVVTIGCKVTVADKNGNTMPAYRIVGSQESDPMNGIISEESPFGKALVGAKEGDTVTVEAPSGAIVYTVQKIER